MSRATTRSLPRSHKPFSVPPQNFIAAFYADVLPTDLALFSAKDRVRIAASIWKLAKDRRAGEVRLRVFNPSLEKCGWTVDHTVVEIVCDNMPFLIDSVTGILQNRGLAVHIVIHPVGAQRLKGENSEFFMHIQIDHCLEREQLQSIEDDVRATLTDVASAVADWGDMRTRVNEAIDDIADSKKRGTSAEEACAFLRWLIDNHFTFLGYREIDLDLRNDEITAIQIKHGRGLGVLRDDNIRMFDGARDMSKRTTPALRKYHRQNSILSVIKTNALARVHRVVPMDAIFIRHFNERGLIVSERLFVGLFTSKTYAESPRVIPIVRHKIEAVITRMNFLPQSPHGRNIEHILNTYPHDELFQISEDELCTNVLGILPLQERARPAMFLRRDPLDHYAACLFYVPRERYDLALRKRVQTLLEDAYTGKVLTWNARIDDNLLARVLVTLRLKPESPHPDPVKLESALREMCRTWSGHLRDYLVQAYGEAEALVLLQRYGDAFPESYRDTVTAAGAARDVRSLERVRQAPRFLANLDEVEKGKSGGRLRLKLLQPDHPLLLSESLPLIENMGLKIDYMGGPYEIKGQDTAPIYIHEFVCRPALPLCIDFERIKPTFEDALAKVWGGEVENDAFNALTLRIGLSWNAIVVLRCFARYLRQLRIPYSHEMMASTLLAHPQVAEQLYTLFTTRHDPALKGSRETKMRVVERTLLESLAVINALEEDRIIRRYLNLVHASLRTNYFQTDAHGEPKAYLSIKFDSHAVDFMPLPKPLVEIFVYSPRIEAVHLRGGKVARGGIRWSDRRDDFRNEILGLMKAQMVKNTVIVPVGSKGGFIVKRPPTDPVKYQAEGIACYKIMMCGLLDITDNNRHGKIVPPVDVMRHDGDDTYLVVAADKGTATFSDIANSISRDYRFWLDDAFASGGSAGYDHKKMGITARGAWEAIKRHFREMGKDIQKHPFSCIGVGDMSGDVFGNGTLLSPHMRLWGAFDHRHIFCDPNPDEALSFLERKRLFALPHSSWDDYNRKLISKGGGVFSRAEKTIKISPEMRRAYGIVADALPPAELIRALLKADVELLYFGGIGTYVKASQEAHDAVGDRANESLRVDGADLRAKIVGEGANLAMTQRGRIEYAQKGGRINTDAIDNSAGVDTSDHEVNIKILLRRAVDRKKLSLAARDKLLASMTDDISHLVLRDNYLQTLVLSASEAQAPQLLQIHARCMRIFEQSGLLNRTVEYLPGEEEIAERQKRGQGLTRPEFAVLLAYAKLWLYHKILDSRLPDDPALQSEIRGYFPKALQRTFSKDIERHQLRREIVATVVTNDIINHAGTRIIAVAEECADAESVARAYLLARDAFALPEIWAGIEALDNKIPAGDQTRMFATIGAALTRAVKRLLANRAALADLTFTSSAMRKGLMQLSVSLAHDKGIIHAIEEVRAVGVPEDLAKRLAIFPALVGALDLIGLANKNKMRVGDLATIFFGLEKRLELSWLSQSAAPTAHTPWLREAIATARGQLSAHHLQLTAQIAARKPTRKQPLLTLWACENAAKLKHYDAMLSHWHEAGAVDLAMLLLANEKLSELSAQP